MRQRSQNGQQVRAVGSDFNGQRPLGCGRQQGVGFQILLDATLKSQAFESGGCKHNGVKTPFV